MIHKVFECEMFDTGDIKYNSIWMLHFDNISNFS